MVFRKTLIGIISSPTYSKILSFIGVMFFQNVIFMQHKFFILEYIFTCFSSNFFFDGTHFIQWKIRPQNVRKTYIPKGLNEDSYISPADYFLGFTRVLCLAGRCICARLRLRVLPGVLEIWSKFAYCSIRVNCYSDNHSSNANPSTHILVY